MIWFRVWFRYTGLFACLVPAVAIAGCGDDETSTTAADTSAGSSGDSGTSQSTSSATTTATGTTTTGTTTVGSTTDGTSDGSTGTTGNQACDVNEVACDLAEGKETPEDCGTISLASPDQDWATAHQCVIDAVGRSGAFKAVFQADSDDSLAFTGWYGTVGFVYGMGMIYSDTFGDPNLEANACESIVAVPGCTPVSGTHCLECENPGATVLTCQFE